MLARSGLSVLTDLYRNTGLAFLTLILIQRGQLFLWVPVFLGGGIGGYFALPLEPDLSIVWSVLAAGLVLAGIAVRAGPVWGLLFWAMALVAGGGALAALRSHQVAAPVLGWRYYGPIEGRIVHIDRSSSDALRLTLDQVYLDRVAPHKRPQRLRLSLHGDQIYDGFAAGAHVMTTGHLSPPAGPVEPGGFDFQRHTWFQRLGAIGYTRNPVLIRDPPSAGEVKILRARMALAKRVREQMPNRIGGIAAALMTGDRSHLDPAVVRDLRRSNLAHLLAISGLHMGLVAGFVFAALRIIGAMIPPVPLHWPLRSLAALGALCAGAGYLVLSGGSVATERAFVMAAVALLALIADRRAISLRALALAAIVVLALRPEALTSPGFQMSFAASAGLVAVFTGLRGVLPKVPGWARGALSLLLSSAVAGAATAPVAAAHFNMIAQYGLIANLLAVPVMGALVIPAAVVAVVLMPLGAEAPALWVMGQGLRWILWVAETTASQSGAVSYVMSPPTLVLILYAIGAMMVIALKGWVRWLGVAPVLACLWVWSGATRPPILIDGQAQIVGLMTAKGRALSHERGGGFVARSWLENDGVSISQDKAAALWPKTAPLYHLKGKRRAAAATCVPGDVLVLTHAPPPGLTCQVFSPKSLAQTGAIALYPIESKGKVTGYKMQTARALAGQRAWNTASIRARMLRSKDPP